MFLSIIIPCYNCSGTIVRTLESIPRTKGIDYEVILVDDCSTDNTIEFIKEYILFHEWVRLIELPANQGPANSRNVGIDAARGQYLAFIDSDDTVTPDYLKKIYDEVKNNQADLINIGISRVYGNSATLVPVIDYKNQSEFMALITGSLCSIISSKTLWEGLRLPCIRNAEDIAVIPVLISRANKICQIKESLYNYIIQPESLSRKPRADVSLNFEKSFDFTCQHINLSNESFRSAIEFHGIKTIIYGAVLNAIKCGLPSKSIYNHVDKFEEKFPQWNKNEHLNKYAFRKRFFLFCVKHRFYLLAKLFVFSHETFINFQSRLHR